VFFEKRIRVSDPIRPIPADSSDSDSASDSDFQNHDIYIYGKIPLQSNVTCIATIIDKYIP
jgi:hypothetical protein